MAGAGRALGKNAIGVPGTPPQTLERAVGVWDADGMARLARVVAPGVPASPAFAALRKAGVTRPGVGEAHRRCTRRINFRKGRRTYLRGASAEELPATLHLHESTGRPLGAAAFVEKLERSLRRPPRPRERGPKPRGKRN